MKEQWERWEPISGLANKYYIDSIIDEARGFKVILSESDDETKKILVLFEDSIDAYRNTDESFRLKIIHDLDQKYGTDFYGDWTFFKVTNSTYIQWLSEQSYGTSDYQSFVHFSFITADSILDVITNYEPKVERFESKMEE